MLHARSYLARDVLELRRLGMLPDWVITPRQHRLVLLLEGDPNCNRVARLLEVTRQAVLRMLRRLVVVGMRAVRRGK